MIQHLEDPDVNRNIGQESDDSELDSERVEIRVKRKVTK